MEELLYEYFQTFKRGGLGKLDTNNFLPRIKSLLVNSSSVKDRCLSLSCAKGHIYLIKLFVKNKADVHVDNDYPLRKALEMRNNKLIKFLITHGANVRILSDLPLRNAIEFKNMPLVHFLLSFQRESVDPRLLNTCGSFGFLEAFQVLRAKGLKIELSCFGNAVAQGHLPILKYGLKHFSIKKDTKSRLLTDACVEGYYEIANFLLRKGSDINGSNDRALRMAAQYGHYELMKYLLSKGADIHVKDDQLLTKSIEEHNVPLFEFLLSTGLYESRHLEGALDKANDSDMSIFRDRLEMITNPWYSIKP